MSHEIDQTVNLNGSAVYAFKPAWHGLGLVLDHAPTAAEALSQAGLAWTVSKEPAYALTEKGLVPVPSAWAIVRNDSNAPLGIVGDDYTILQNAEAFEALAHVLEDNGLTYESAGALREGRSVWLLARSPESHKIVDGDSIIPYILLSTSHVGKSSVRILGTSVRVVCANTERIALSGSEGRGAALRHTPNLPDRIKQARQIFARYRLGVTDYVTMARQMAATAAPDSLRKSTIKLAVDLLTPPAPDPATLLRDIIGTANQDSERTLRERRRAQTESDIMANLLNPRQATAKDSVWALHNAITEYIEHQTNGQRGDDRARAENRFENLLYGPKEEVKHEIFSSLSSYVRAA